MGVSPHAQQLHPTNAVVGARRRVLKLEPKKSKKLLVISKQERTIKDVPFDEIDTTLLASYLGIDR
jgi:alpha-ketoglutarate-dependent taurine dioxygenase